MFKWLGNATSAPERRPRRLAVLDAATVDKSRRLVLIRRDNIEHLLMIGGSADVVIEPNIVRTSAREPAQHTGSQPSGPATEPLQRLAPPEITLPPQRRAPHVRAPSSSLKTSHNLEDLTRQLEAALQRFPAPQAHPPVTDPLVISPKVQLEAPNFKLEHSNPSLEARSEPNSDPHMDLANAEAEFKSKPQGEPEPELEPPSEPQSQRKPENSKKASDIL